MKNLKTPVRVLFDDFKNQIQEIDKALSYNNPYLVGYKQCLVNIIKDCEALMIEAEKKRIIEAWDNALDLEHSELLDVVNGSDYYETFFNK